MAVRPADSLCVCTNFCMIQGGRCADDDAVIGQCVVSWLAEAEALSFARRATSADPVCLVAREDARTARAAWSIRSTHWTALLPAPPPGITCKHVIGERVDDVSDVD